MGGVSTFRDHSDTCSLIRHDVLGWDSFLFCTALNKVHQPPRLSRLGTRAWNCGTSAFRTPRLQCNWRLGVILPQASTTVARTYLRGGYSVLDIRNFRGTGVLAHCST